jgi:DNA-binding NtrC family response regulator
VLGTEDWIPAELGRRVHGVVPDPAVSPPAAPDCHHAQVSNGNRNGHGNGNGQTNGNGLREISRQAARHAECLALRAVLDEVHWHRGEAAKRLGVSYKTLLYKIKQHRLEASSFVPRSQRDAF